MSIAGIHRPDARTETWLTPPYVLHALGAFDLDPCAAPPPRPWATASRMVSLPDNGLTIPWEGRVWMNPPYGAQLGRWLARLAQHGNGIALTFARTETAAFVRTVWGRADAVLFLHGRLTFHLPDGQVASTGNSGGPSCLVAYGERNVLALRESELDGTLVERWRRTAPAAAQLSLGRASS